MFGELTLAASLAPGSWPGKGQTQRERPGEMRKIWLMYRRASWVFEQKSPALIVVQEITGGHALILK